MSTALKITPATDAVAWGTDIEFTDTEVRECICIPNMECFTCESHLNKPRVYDRSKASAYTFLESMRTFRIVINVQSGITDARLATLFSNKLRFKVYFEYIHNPASYAICFLNPNKEEILVMGKMKVRQIILTFYEIHDTITEAYGIKLIPELYVDIDNENIKIGSIHDIQKISEIKHQINYAPGKIDKIKLYDIKITLNDYDEFYSPSCTRGDYKPFRILWSPLNVAASVGDTNIQIDTFSVGGERFVSGDKFCISDGNNSEYRVITSLGQDGSDQILYFTSPLVYGYAKESMVSTIPLLGQKVKIVLRKEVGGIYDSEKIIFRGFIREPFMWSSGKAIIKADNLLVRPLLKPLRIASGSTSPIQRTNASGSLVSTISWTTQTGSGVLSGVTVYPGSQLGKYEITFSDATNFTVTGPSVNSKAGTTGTDFYDQTDADDSQIQIPSGNWSGTPATGDVVEFYVSLNFSAKRVDQIITTLLTSHGGIDSGDIHYQAMNHTETITMSFDKSGTIGDAIMAVTPHAMTNIVPEYDGTIRITRIEQFDLGSLDVNGVTLQAKNITMNNLIQEPNKLGYTDFINEFIIYYGWDPTIEDYQYKYIYPQQDILNPSYKILGEKRSVTLYMPAFYSESNVETWAKRNYAIWCMGLLSIEVESNLNAIYNCGDILWINMCNPNIHLYARIYKTELSLIRKNRMKYYCLAHKLDAMDYWI